MQQFTRSYTADSLKALEDSHAELLTALQVAIATRDPTKHRWIAEAKAAITKAREIVK